MAMKYPMPKGKGLLRPIYGLHATAYWLWASSRPWECLSRHCSHGQALPRNAHTYGCVRI